MNGRGRDVVCICPPRSRVVRGCHIVPRTYLVYFFGRCIILYKCDFLLLIEVHNGVLIIIINFFSVSIKSPTTVLAVGQPFHFATA